MDLPRRKPLRLPDYDYSTPGAYFVTICTEEKRCIISRIRVGAIHESPAALVSLTREGRCVERVITALPERYPELQLDHYVIMPNHVHLLLQIKAERAIRESPLQSDGKRSRLDKAIGYLKMNSSKLVHSFQPELKLWQRSYHEHVVRNEVDYLKIWNYIDSNPGKWTEDRYWAE